MICNGVDSRTPLLFLFGRDASELLGARLLVVEGMSVVGFSAANMGNCDMGNRLLEEFSRCVDSISDSVIIDCRVEYGDGCWDLFMYESGGD